MIKSSQLTEQDMAIVNLTLALMYLTSWTEKSVFPDEGDIHSFWKGYDHWALNLLEDLDLIYSGKRRSNKSACFTEEGEELARRLAESISIDGPSGEILRLLKRAEAEEESGNAG